MPTLIDRHLKIPQYLQLAQHLRQEIESGNLSPGDRLPSLTELKQRFGANQRTVEKAHTLLENDGLIRREPGRGVFVENPSLRPITRNVGFITRYDNMGSEENITYWGAVLSGMRQVAREREYHVLLIDNGETFIDWEKIDGALLYDANPRVASIPPGFLGLSLLNEAPGMACVASDDFDAAYQLTRHLIDLGHRRIAFLVEMESEVFLVKERKAGYLKALSESGIERDERWMRDLTNHEKPDKLLSLPYFFRAGQHAVGGWLEEDWESTGCTALIAQNDSAAFGTIRAFEAAGLNVPHDVSVVGFDGIPSENSTPQLTTIEIPLREIGRRAMTLLLEKLENPKLSLENVHLPVRLIQGRTTAPPAGAVIKSELVIA